MVLRPLNCLSRDSFQFLDDVQVDRATALAHVAGAFSFTLVFRHGQLSLAALITGLRE